MPNNINEISTEETKEDKELSLKKPKAAFQTKDKPIIFSLEKEMTMSNFISEGYQRKEVEILFSELEAASIGVYNKGKLGRGRTAKFICNDGFPEKYTIILKTKRLQHNYIGKPE